MSLDSFAKYIKKEVNLAALSSFAIGGNAKYVAFPQNEDMLKSMLRTCQNKGIPFRVFGYGANVLFPDNPSNNIFYISMTDYQWLAREGGSLILSAGIPLSFLSLLGLLLKREDFAFSYLLPGSIGGGTFINARCLNRQMSDIVSKIHYLDYSIVGCPQKKILTASQAQYGYKKSIFQDRPWLISKIEIKIPGLTDLEYKECTALLETVKGISGLSSLETFFKFFQDKARILTANSLPESYQEVEDMRIKSQHFKYPSCGSVFKNNYEYGTPTGVLVDQLGLKGTQRGGAMISPHHGNFIVNFNSARAQDVEYLINYIEKKIQENFAFVPEKELIIF